MQNVPQKYHDLSQGGVRPHTYGLWVSFDKAYDDTITFGEWDTSDWDSGDLWSPPEETLLPTWNFYDYRDYSDRVVDMEWERSIQFPYSVVSAMADFTVNNYDNYFTPDSGSPIDEYILPKRPLRLYAGFRGAGQLQQFIGLNEKMPVIDQRSKTAQFHALDFLSEMFALPLTDLVAMATIPSTESTVTNLCINPSIEVSASGWSVVLGVGARVADATAPFGDYSYQLTNSGGGNASASITGDITSGTKYRVSFYVKNNGGSTQVSVFQNSNTIYQTTSVTTDWVRHSFTFTSTSTGAISIDLSQATSDTSVYIDGIMVTEGSTLHDYFDGSFTDTTDTDYEWTGTAGLSTSTKVTGEAGQTITTDVVLAAIFEMFGLEESQYVLSKGRNIIPFVFFDQGKNAGNAFRELMQAEGGNLWLDEQGIIRFEPRLLPVDDPVMEFNDSNVEDIQTSGDSEIINTVRIKTDVRQVQEFQPVYSSSDELGNSTLLEPVVVPANGTKFFTAELIDPLLSAEAPTLGQEIDTSWFTAKDVDGTNVTSGVSVTLTNLNNNNYVMLFSNSNGFEVTIDKIEVWGRPAKLVEGKGINYTAYDEDSVDKYGEKVLEIDNNLFGSESNAESFALTIIDAYKELNGVIEMTVKGDPSLQLGDIVTVDTREIIGEYKITYIRNSYMNQKATTILKATKYTPREWGFFDITEWDDGSLWAP